MCSPLLLFLLQPRQLLLFFSPTLLIMMFKAAKSMATTRTSELLTNGEVKDVRFLSRLDGSDIIYIFPNG